MRGRWIWALCLGVVAASGCGGSKTGNAPPTKDDLRDTALFDVGELYRVYMTQNNNKPPAKLADVTPLEQMSPRGLDALKTGEIVVFWNANLPDTGEVPGKGAGDSVLAYEKRVPTEGGKVLMINRTVKDMTADEFKSAPKASTSSSEAEKAKK